MSLASFCVAASLESTLVDPSTFEGHAMQVFVRSFATEGMKRVQSRSGDQAETFATALVRNLRDFVDRMHDHSSRKLEDQGRHCDYRSVLRIVLAPLTATLVQAVAADAAPRDIRLAGLTETMRGVPARVLAASCGVPEPQRPSRCSWDAPAAVLDGLDEALLAPLQQLHILVRVVALTCAELRRQGVALPSADDVTPVMCYLVARCQLRHAASSLVLLRGVCNPRRLDGEALWALTTFEAALHFLETTLAQDSALTRAAVVAKASAASATRGVTGGVGSDEDDEDEDDEDENAQAPQLKLQLELNHHRRRRQRQRTSSRESIPRSVTTAMV